MSSLSISLKLYSRLARYLNYLKQLEADGINISATAIAEALELNHVQVRKDLARVSSGGKPKIGYVRVDLIADIEHFLGHDSSSGAALVGVGNLGKALLSYKNFETYGLQIAVAFDNDPSRIGNTINGKTIANAENIADVCKEMNIRIGIITVPAAYAQDTCDALIRGGIRAIWNFAPVNLKIPENVAVKNEDMAASLAILTKQLAESIETYGLN